MDSVTLNLNDDLHAIYVNAILLVNILYMSFYGVCHLDILVNVRHYPNHMSVDIIIVLYLS